MVSMTDATCKNFMFYVKMYWGAKTMQNKPFIKLGVVERADSDKTKHFCKPPITPDPAETAELARTDRPPQTSARRP